VTALAWHPPSPPRADPAPGAPPLLASGDAEGRVAVWDAAGGGAPRAALADPVGAAFGRGGGGGGTDPPPGGVRGLAWATAANLLCVLVAPGYLLLWDPRAGGVVWRRNLAGEVGGGFASLRADPFDRRAVVLASPSGALAALRFDSPSSDRVRAQRFQVGDGDRGGGGALLAAAPTGARDLLLLLLHRELILFDLEFGAPAGASSRLASICFWIAFLNAAAPALSPPHPPPLAHHPATPPPPARRDAAPARPAALRSGPWLLWQHRRRPRARRGRR
jgi:hypothetical protein